LPGGDLAARQPWRNLLAQCLAFVPDWETLAPNWETLAPAGVIPTDAVPLLTRAIGRGLNAPLASSAGRL
ncbi:hypothetical protein F7102_22680, partial [Dickeya dianthicola]|nr:hypothetical protein [Dickeya dianthicola]